MTRWAVADDREIPKTLTPPSRHTSSKVGDLMDFGDSRLVIALTLCFRDSRWKSVLFDVVFPGIGMIGLCESPVES